MEAAVLGVGEKYLRQSDGIFGFLKKTLSRDQSAILTAVVTVLGSIGGVRSEQFLKTLAKDNSPLARTARKSIKSLWANLKT